MLVAIAVLPSSALHGQQGPARDQQRFTSSGTSVVRGTVVADDAARTPLRRAQVTLSRVGAEDIRAASTDDQGQFAFSDLPAATYSLGASKGGFIAMSAGAVKPGMPGRQVLLREGDSVVVPPISLPRGAVIAGRITDSTGRPVSNAQVQASRFVTVSGERQARSGSTATWATTTNDHGDYRLFGLLSGEYIVSAWQSGTTIQSEITAADLEAARPTAAGVVAQPPAVARPFALAHTLYPGTVDESSAAPIVLKPGEERLGVDMPLQRVPVARVSGTVVGVDGKPLVGVTITRRLRRSPAFTPVLGFGAASAADGSFTLTGVAPGDYVLQAQGNSAADIARATELARMGLAAAPSQNNQGPPMWASVDVPVNGADISGVTLRMQPGMTVSGTVTAASARIDVTRARLLLGTSTGAPGRFVSASPDGQGAFRFDGFPPGRYTLSFPGLQAGVIARSAMLGDVDLLDGPFEIRPGGSLSGIAITLTDVRTELGGILTNASGQPASHLYVLAFSQDRAHWIRDSRRILSARAGEDGSYTISGLPAGNYFLCALTEIDTTLQFEAEYLDQLVPASLKITLADGEKKVQHLRAGG